jgi:hydroxypyruvate reductase
MRVPTRDAMLAAYGAAIDAVDPYESVLRNLVYSDRVVTVGGESVGGFAPADIVVIGIGKAATAMATAVADVTGARRGLVVTPYAGPCPIEVVVGGHPIPDATSIAAGEAVTELARTVRSTDLVIFVVSGGGSAALELPVDGVDLEDLRAMNEALVLSGAPIEAINAVRASVSSLKAGGLRASLGGATVASLVLSDIPNDNAGLVSSGPSIPSEFEHSAAEVIAGWELAEAMPDSVLEAAGRSSKPRLAAPDDVVVTVGSPQSAATAAGEHLRDAGYAVEVMATPIEGDAAEAVEMMLAAATLKTVVAGGEATVRVDGSGLGGRNQHAALVAAMSIRGTGRRFGALGTDGVDGPSDAAGAIVDGTTAARSRSLGYDLAASLSDFDSHPLLVSSGDVVITGATGTNVADLWIATPDVAP